MRVPLPKEHGAWVMLALALVAGWASGPLPHPVAALLVSVAVLLGFLAQAAWLAGGASSRRLWAWEGLLALVAVSGAMWISGAALAPALGVVGLSALLAEFLRASSSRGGRVKLSAYGAHLSGAVALAGCVWIVRASQGGEWTTGLDSWWTLAVAFGSGVLLVQGVRPTRSRSLVPLYGLVGVAAGWMVLSWNHGGAGLSLAWTPVLLRALAAPYLVRNPMGWKQMGWAETAMGLWTVVWMP